MLRDRVRVHRSVLAHFLGFCSIILMFPLVIAQSSDYCIHHYSSCLETQVLFSSLAGQTQDLVRLDCACRF